MFSFNCSSCQKFLTATEELAGQPAVCHFCLHCVKVPPNTHLPPAGPIIQSAWGKYSKWARGLDEDRMHAALWAVGEYGMRAEALLKCLHEHESEFTPGHERAIVALQLLSRMVGGIPCGLEEVMEKMRAAVSGHYSE